jgi:hypothetical protein
LHGFLLRGLCFSNYMAKMIGGGELIYHGSEPAASRHNTSVEATTTKLQARASFMDLAFTGMVCLPDISKEKQ